MDDTERSSIPASLALAGQVTEHTVMNYTLTSLKVMPKWRRFERYCNMVTENGEFTSYV